MTEHDSCRGLKTARLPDFLSAVACGFLLGKGLSGGAVAVGWSMAALLGGGWGKLYGAALFAAGCAVVCVVRQGFGKRANALLNGAVLCLFTLWQQMTCAHPWNFSAIAECLPIAAALLLTDGRRTGAVQAACLAVVLVAGLLMPVPDGELALRLAALCSSLSSAGLTGAALAHVSSRESELSWPWLVAGAALGVV